MMVVKKNFTYLITLAFIFLLGCKEEKNMGSVNRIAPKVVEATGYVVPQDSIQPPEIIRVKGLKSIPVGKPTVIQFHSNITPVPSLEIGHLPKPKVCTPGQDTFKLPEIITVIEKPFIAGLPDIVEVKPPQILDFNTINFSSFNTLQGLNNNIIFSIYQDRKGNIWIGTWGGGVAKYDGKSFTHYSTAQGLSNDVVYSILEDRNDNLWFGTGGGGAIKFDGKYLTVFTTKEGLLGNEIRDLLEDKNGNIWISTNKGVSKYDGKSFTNYSTKQGLRYFGRHLYEDRNGDFWFKSNKGGFSKYDDNSFFNYTQNDIKITYSWGDLVASIQSDKFDGISYARYSTLLQNRRINKFHVGQSRNIWFLSNQELNRYDGKSIEQHRVTKGVFGNSNMLEDKNGNLWIGTNGNGIIKSNGLLFTHLSTEQGLSNKKIRSVIADKNDNIWVGTFGGGVNKLDGLSISVYTTAQGLSSNNVTAICEDRNGDIWFGTWGGGVDKYDGKTFTNYSRAQGLIRNNISDIYEDSKGNIWFGTYLGASKFDGKTFTNFSTNQGLSGSDVFSILEDSKSNIWFGARGSGLNKYDGSSFTHYGRENGLNDETVHAMLEDKSGNIWFGTANGGVNKFDGLTFTHYTVDQGLANNNVNSILEDKDGTIWFGTSDGLSKMRFDGVNDKNQNVANKSNDGSSFFKNYLYSDGFLGVGTWYNSLVQDSKGTIWAGTSDRITRYDPEEDIVDTIPPNIQLSSIKLFNDNINWLNVEKNKDTTLLLSNGVKIKNLSFTGLSSWYYYPENLELNYNSNSVSFEFVGITTNKPTRVKYKYLLEGFDENWSTETNQSEASYNNLSHGSYTFKVKCANSEGYWSNEFLYPFVINPPWWHTWVAYLFYGLCAIAGIFLVDRYQRRRLIEKERQKSREKELEQAKEIEKAYRELQATQSQLIQSEKMASLGELTAGIAHEIQNPLNFVNNFSEVSGELVDEMQDELNMNNPDVVREIAVDLKQNLEKINHHGQRASGIVKGMLEHSRIGDGVKEPTDINILADEYLRLAYHGLRAKDKSFNADFNTEFDETLPKINVIPQDIGRVLLNLINNAFYAVDKKAKSGTEGFKPEVFVSTKKLEDSIQISVKDNGPGIPKEIKNKIFQPFFTTKPTGSGTGLGLSLSYDIVKAHGGEIKVESEEGMGCDFVITLPIV